MDKLKCENCDYYAENQEYAYCRMQDKKIQKGNEKTRCKWYCMTDLCWKCKFYLPWVETSKGEVTHACVDNEKRTIRRCNQYNHPERCNDFQAKQ